MDISRVLRACIREANKMLTIVNMTFEYQNGQVEKLL